VRKSVAKIFDFELRLSNIMKKEKIIELSMKFNPGLEKYEPELPTKKSDKPIKFSWIKFLLIILIIVAVGILTYIFLK